MKYETLYKLTDFWLKLCHPNYIVKGLENIPQEGNMLICVNHRAMTDPFWVLYGLHLPQMPRIMAKAQLMKVPVLGAILRSIRVIGVRRGENDIAAVKATLGALKGGENLFIFPEGTRVRGKKKHVRAKVGAVSFALKTNTPILPVYIDRNRRWFAPLYCIVGKPYYPLIESAKPTREELHAASDEMMDKIYALEAEK